MTLDVAVRGVGNRWDDAVVPDMHYVVVENTLRELGARLESFSKLPLNMQQLVGSGV